VECVLQARGVRVQLAWDLMSGVRVGGGRERVVSRRSVDAVARIDADRVTE